MEDPMPKPPQAYGKLQDIKGLASPQSSPVRCSPGGAGLRSAAAAGWPLTSFRSKNTWLCTSRMPEISHALCFRQI